MFYLKLALTNLKKNGKTYVPYLLTCVLTVMMFYVMSAISRNEGLDQMPGAGSMKTILAWAAIITGIFSAVFLFYTNSFLVKQRKKEFGLYQVLGMDKRNLAKMMKWETILTVIFSLTAGLLGGVLLGRLMFLILLKIIHFPVSLKFAVESQALIHTVILFLAIFFVTLLFNLLQVQTANPIELLHGGNQGEKEPKTKWLLTLIGVVTLGIGYYIAQTTDAPLTALTKFFIAVILVIIGTYALFMAGSIAFLKNLKKNKKFYYQTKHFTSVSGMIYRMKQNAVGLANICIMSTIVLVLISVSVSLYAGMEDIMDTRFPTDFRADIYNTEEENLSKVEWIIEEEMQKAGIESTDRISYRSGRLAAVWDKQEERLLLDQSNTDVSYVTEDFRSVMMIPLSDFNKMEDENITLEEDQLLVYMPGEKFDSDKIMLQDKEYQVKQVLEEMKIERNNMSYVLKTVYLIVDDTEQITQMLGQYGFKGDSITYSDMFNLKGDEKAVESAMQHMKERLAGEMQEYTVEYRAAYSQEFYALYGGFLFLGIFVGALFLMATVLIIYYKQISEGYDDRGRYQIMQKVGMNLKEVKSSIRSQVLTVFFLPLAAAVIHVAVAFKVVTKLLAVLNLVNVHLFLICTIGTVGIFAIFYVVIFLVTSREYYNIIKDGSASI
ncbi:FtsX-like permease family protein [Faecalicatena contorta]|uniref:Putative ABC transport system permease protein n=1 Tax=Faecalicatena contorta TaxID=39482 RepID=A0A316AEP5_9FIRM|nr:FtsX-like permease family protein [Faecalicatena contorta]PWJ48247.1 putative ABC transport system permease protein [Faecalicatena contorta]SUQ15523.1 putative ABC transport system permease protein [Faecalicatena contorta]